MIKEIKNILNLTKIFFKNSFQNPYIIDKKTNKIDKRSIFVWLIIIVIIAISYLSFQIIKVLVDINQATIFLSIFFLILMIIMLFQVILSSSNIYFFSKDLELILPLPIKSEKLLISKFNTILINLYFTELIFAIIPLIIYGVLTNSGIIYYLYLIVILLIFPILPILIVSIIMMFLMKLSKFIKNKDVFQMIVTLIFILIIFILEFKIGTNVINKIDNNLSIESQQVASAFNNFNEKLLNVNKYFLEINSTVDILNNHNKLNCIFNLFKIIFIDLIFLFLFIFIGKKYYLKNILNNNNNFYLKKVNRNKLEKKIKKINVNKSYIKKEFKILFKNPTFFMQCIFPMLIIIVSFILIIAIGLPNIRAILTSDLMQQDIMFSVDLSVICLILGIIQIMFTTSNISMTSISREGKNAIYMKFIPVDYYKQFIYKTRPQIFINGILTTIIIFLIKLIFSEFDLIYLIYLFVLSNLLNIINSKLMVLVDLIKPNLNWQADYEAIKQNNNKLYQYVLTIIIILLLVYFNKIFSEINLNLACVLIILILSFFVLIINKIVKINIKKIFLKIN